MEAERAPLMGPQNAERRGRQGPRHMLIGMKGWVTVLWSTVRHGQQTTERDYGEHITSLFSLRRSQRCLSSRLPAPCMWQTHR